MRAVDSPDSTAAAHADGRQRARHLPKSEIAWLPSEDIVSFEDPHSISACLSLSDATTKTYEIECVLEEIESVKLTSAVSVRRPYFSVRADRKSREPSEWTRDLEENSPSKVEANGIRTALGTPNVAAAD